MGRSPAQVLALAKEELFAFGYVMTGLSRNVHIFLVPMFFYYMVFWFEK